MRPVVLTMCFVCKLKTEDGNTGAMHLEEDKSAMHLREGVWGVRMRFLGISAVFFAFDGSDNDATSESGGDLCG
jgi:hypothetical protein